VKRRVAITGLGSVTAVGEGIQALWSAALESRSGVGRVRFGEEGGLDFPGAAVLNFTPEKFVVQRKALKVMARDIQLAVAAAELAVADAGAKNLPVARERFGIIVGSGVLNHELDELAYSVCQSLGPDGRLDLGKFGTDGLPALFPLWLLKYLPNMPACHISIFLDLEGPSNTLTTGPSSGLQAVCEAARIIRRGTADLMLAGGAESKLNPLGLSQYQLMGVLAGAEGEALSACRPFDDRSRGIVVGEGAGFLVLEELEHARKRGAKIYAEITGFGVSSENNQKTALRAAVRESGLAPGDVDYVQACGLGVTAEDRLEAEAIRECSPGAIVSASKPLLGFTGFSAGALDLILSTLAVQNGVVPPVAHAAAGDRFGLRLVSGSPQKKNVRHAVTNAFGLGGQCVSVVTRSLAGGA